MNDSVLATLSWNDSDDFDEEVLEKGFRNIKKRANHKIVEFNIQKTFINSFKKFLKLRRYVLNGNKIDKLFFIGYGKNVQVSATQGKGTFASNI